MKPEILAPAGSFEALTAAVRCGADAVYVGGRRLNARRSATNFSDEELCEAAKLCHAYGAKLHLTLNTIVKDSEADDVHKMVETAARAGVDALIVQDLGVAKIVRACSDIPMHASTQMSVQTPSGVKLLESLGFSRIVVPRELQKKELLEIRNATTAELEMFVHGALCMSVSGQCLMSAMFGGRSGNRGLCAQPCRLPFQVPGGTGYDLSLKDNSLLPYLRELSDMGIASFKIEGRMKRPEYVAAAVTACRKALEGATEDEIFDTLRRVFSRSGFTDGYYTGHRGSVMFGTRQKEDVTAASDVLPKLQKLYESTEPICDVQMHFSAKRGEPVTLKAVTEEHSASVQGEIPGEAKNRALDEDTVRKQLTKCGGTIFSVDTLNMDIEDGLFLPVSSLNALRRDALDALYEKRAKHPGYTYTQQTVSNPVHIPAKMRTYMRFADPTQIPKNCDADKLILPIYCDSAVIASFGAAVELPRGMFGREEEIRNKLLLCKKAGVTEAVFGTLDGLALIQECGLSPIAGFGTNIYNSTALTGYGEMGVREALLSVETTLSEAQHLSGDLPRGVLVYGHVPLMLVRNCPQRNGKTCAQCQKTGTITDRKGITFPIECRSGCSEILNACPIHMADKLSSVREQDFMLLYFTKESPDECLEVIDRYRDKTAPSGTFTRGLLFRGVE